MASNTRTRSFNEALLSALSDRNRANGNASISLNPIKNTDSFKLQLKNVYSDRMDDPANNVNLDSLTLIITPNGQTLTITLPKLFKAVDFYYLTHMAKDYPKLLVSRRLMSLKGIKGLTDDFNATGISPQIATNCGQYILKSSRDKNGTTVHVVPLVDKSFNFALTCTNQTENIINAINAFLDFTAYLLVNVQKRCSQSVARAITVNHIMYEVNHDLV